MDDRREADEAPEFGPSGYLPERASRRARKIILRAPLGLQWVVGSLVVGVIVVVAGVLLLRETAPDAPYVELGPIDAVTVFGEDVQFTPLGAPGFDGDVLVLREGRPRVFTYTGARPVPCDENGLLESADGGTWRPTGRGLGGTPSLTEHPAVVFEGVLYADPTTTLPVLAPDDTPVEQRCGGTGTPTPAPSDADG